MAVNAGPDIIEDGLVLCLDAGNRRSYPGSGTSWTDLSGNGNNGTLSNGASFETSNSGGVVCDGVDDYITVAETANLTPQVLTAEVVVKINSHTNTVSGGASSSDQYLLFRQNTRVEQFEGYSIGYEETNQRIWTYVATSAGTYYGLYSPNNSTPLGNTHVITSVFDATTISLYINGAFISSAAKVSGIDYNATHTLKIGRSVPEGATWDRAANATFYGVKIYNRALAGIEVAQNFNALRGRFGL